MGGNLGGDRDAAGGHRVYRGLRPAGRPAPAGRCHASRGHPCGRLYRAGKRVAGGFPGGDGGNNQSGATPQCRPRGNTERTPRDAGPAMNSLASGNGRIGERRGVALVLVLWVVLVLSLLISGFAFTMHVETQVASYARKEMKAEMLARSGIEVARMQLILDQQSPTDAGFDALNQEWATNELMYVAHELVDGIFNVKVTDEESKIPINNGGDLQLKHLMDLLNVDPSDG